MDFKPHFDKYSVNGCFVLYNQSDNEIIRYNLSLCDSGYIPASTFKIPNSLIALEEGIIKDTCHIIKWGGVHIRGITGGVVIILRSTFLSGALFFNKHNLFFSRPICPL
jgi:hypothetical protein